ncbi:MAG: exonuclease SbcCD subunit D C-terminal domain-containing protein [Rhizobiaceae bacterium]
MKILHTADWHLGRQFCGQTLESDHDAVLAQVLDAIETHQPDALIIAGDIYDRASPPISAVRQFNAFLGKVASESSSAIVMIAGNHDSGDRIASHAILADPKRALIRGPLSVHEQPLIIEDQHGPVAFSGLPFGNEFSARECYGDTSISCPADVLAAQVACARAHVPEDARWVIAAHAFVANATPSESERSLQVGGIETVPASVFDGAHYIALGHLHRPQGVGAPHIRYSGSPLSYGFDEAESQKSMTLVDLAADGTVSLQELPFTPSRAVRMFKGPMKDLLAVASAAPSDDFFKIVLTDKGAIIDPMGQVREYYPNATVLTYERDEEAAPVSGSGSTSTSTSTSLDDPLAVVGEFLSHVRGEEPSDVETTIVTTALNQLAAAEENP